MHGIELGKNRLPLSSVVLLTVVVSSFFCTPLLLMQMYRSDGPALNSLALNTYNSNFSAQNEVTSDGKDTSTGMSVGMNDTSILVNTNTEGDTGVIPKANVPAVRWRSDGHCGNDFLLGDGLPAECNPRTKKRCCNKWGYCQLCS